MVDSGRRARASGSTGPPPEPEMRREGLLRKSTMIVACRLVPTGLWVGFDKFAVHQGEDERTFLPSSQKALRALIAFPYSNAKRNK